MQRLLLPALLALLLLASAYAFAPTASTLTGTLTDGQGQPLAGVFVTARTADAPPIEVSVRTNAAGRYELALPREGRYAVHAHGLGYAPTEPDTVRAGVLDFRLTAAPDLFAQVPSSSYLNLLPDGETKRQFILDCTGCHQFNRVRGTASPLQRTHADWVQQTQFMLSFAGASSGFPIMSPSREAEATADWLTEHLGRPDQPRPAVAPPSFPLAEERVQITEYPLPIPQELPHDLYPDGEGKIVVTGMMTARMYRLDPTTGTYEHHFVGQAPGARALTVDADGRWWVLLGGPRQIARFDPASGERQTFDIGMYPHSIARDDQGRIWFNGHFTKEPEQIGYVDPATGRVRTFDVPTPPMEDDGSTIPYGMRLGPDGTVWATQLTGNRLLRFDPNTRRFELYDMPTAHSGPRRLDIAPDGTVWIPEYAAGKLARFDPATETFREYDLPIRDALPYIVRVDPRSGVVWIATGAADAVLRFFPETERFAVHPLPTRSALIRHMELAPQTGSAWVAYGNSPATAPKIARIDVLD